MSDILTTYTDHNGNERPALFLSWEQAENILGHPHRHTDEDDRALIAALETINAPIPESPMVADGRHGWYLVGPVDARKVQPV